MEPSVLSEPEPSEPSEPPAASMGQGTGGFVVVGRDAVYVVASVETGRVSCELDGNLVTSAERHLLIVELVSRDFSR